MLFSTFFDKVKYKSTDFIARDADIFGAGISQLTDFPLTFPTTPNMTVSVGAGVARVNGYRIANDLTPITLTVAAADPSNPRIDIIQIGYTASTDANGDTIGSPVLQIKQGVPGASPIEPGADPNFVKLYAINVAANATAITNANVIDRRSLVPLKVSGTQIQYQGVPSQVEFDAKFDGATGHKHTGAAGDAPKIDSTGLADGAATDAIIGNRTISDVAAPTSDTGSLTTLASWIANMIKQITGKANWYTAPRITLEYVADLRGQAFTGDISTTGNALISNSLQVGGASASESVRLVSPASGDATFVSFYKHDNATRKGFVGYGSTDADIMFVYADTGDIQLSPGSGKAVTVNGKTILSPTGTRALETSSGSVYVGGGNAATYPFLNIGWSNTKGTPQFVGNWPASGMWGIGPATGTADNTVKIGPIQVGSDGTYDLNPDWNDTLAFSLRVQGGLSISGGAGHESAAGNTLQFLGGYASPFTGRAIIGDGSGWKFAFSSYYSSALHDVLIIQDNGKLNTPNNTLDDGNGIINALGYISSGDGTANKGAVRLLPGSGAAWWWMQNNSGTLEFTLGGTPGGQLGLELGPAGEMYSIHNILDDGNGLIALGNVATIKSTSSANFEIAPVATGAVGFTNAAQSNWGLRVVDGASPATYTLHNTLDDSAGNMQIGGARFQSVSGSDLDIVPSVGKNIGFTNSAVNGWLLRADDATGALYSANHTLDNGSGWMHLMGNGVQWTSSSWKKMLSINEASMIEFGYGTASPFGIGQTSGSLFFMLTNGEDNTAAPNYLITFDGTLGHATFYNHILFQDSGEHQIRHALGGTSNWGYYLNAAGFGAYDWFTNTSVFSYGHSTATLGLDAATIKINGSMNIYANVNVAATGAGASSTSLNFNFNYVTPGGVATYKSLYGAADGSLIWGGADVWTTANFDPNTKAAVTDPTINNSLTITTGGDALLSLYTTEIASTNLRKKTIINSMNDGFSGNGWIFRGTNDSGGIVDTTFDGTGGTVWTNVNLPVSSAATANNVVKRDGSGYVYGVIFNDSWATNDSDPVGAFVTKNGSDGFLRNISVARAQSILGTNSVSKVITLLKPDGQINVGTSSAGNTSVFTSTGGSFILSAAKMLWRSNYQGGKSVWFEVVVASPASGTVYASLIDLSAGNAIIGQVSLTNNTSPTRLTSGAISLTNAHEYCVALWSSGGTSYLYDAEIIVD